MASNVPAFSLEADIVSGWKTVRAIEMAAAQLLARIGAAILATTKHCRACRQKNRVIHGRKGARCGKCGFPLGDVVLR